MRKVSPRLVAIMMASVVSVTSIAPVTAYNHVTVNAAQLQQQAIDWTFTGNGKVDNDKIQLSGAGDNIGITNIKIIMRSKQNWHKEKKTELSV